MSNNTSAQQASLSAKKASPKARTAVLFYGMLRNFEIGANSIKRHMLYDDECDVFYFGPRDTDNPDVNYTVGLMDKDGFFIENPKEKFQHTEQADTEKFLEIYKPFIKKASFHDMTFSQFEDISLSLRPKEDWLMGLNPARMISMFYNMGGVIDMVLNHIDGELDTYDKIIVTRTDLVIYSRIACILSGQEMHIPFGEGFGPNGEKHRGNASTLYYKNMITGDYSPGGRTANFNDQIMVIKGQDLAALRNLFQTVTALIRDHVPLSPETILYIVCKRCNFDIHTHDEWHYEIYRDGRKPIQSVLDIPDLEKIDRYNPRLRQSENNTPAKTASDILGITRDEFARLRKSFFLRPVLLGREVRRLSDEKLLGYVLRSKKRIVGIVKKSLSEDLSRQGISVFSLTTNDVHSQCAMRVGQKGVIIPQAACHALYGPYIRLEPGRYTAEFVFDEIEGDRVLVDVTSPTNATIAEAQIKIKGDKVISIDWELTEAHNEVEIRLFAFPGFKGIFEYLLIQKK